MRRTRNQADQEPEELEKEKLYNQINQELGELGTRRNIQEPGKLGARGTRNQGDKNKENQELEELGTRRTRNQELQEPGDQGARRTLNQKNQEPGELETRRSQNQENQEPGKLEPEELLKLNKPGTRRNLKNFEPGEIELTAYYVVCLYIEYCNAYPSATMTITDTNENILFLDSIRAPPPLYLPGIQEYPWKRIVGYI